MFGPSYRNWPFRTDHAGVLRPPAADIIRPGLLLIPCWGARIRTRAVWLVPVFMFLLFIVPSAASGRRPPADFPACHSLSIVANPSNGGAARAESFLNCRGGYLDGTTVSLAATPAEGWSFASWTSGGGVGGGVVRSVSSPVTTIVVDGPTVIGANFVRNPRAPAAHFVFAPASPRAGDTVRLTDTSSGFPTSWSWDLDGHGGPDSTSAHPTWIFSSPGTYTVRLTASNSSGSSTITTDVTVRDPPSNLDVVHPNPELIASDGTITADPSRVAASTRIAVGATTDGATRLVFRYTAPGPGQVTFSLAAGTPADAGGFLASGSSVRAATVTAPVAAVGSGFLACAVYLVPDDFNLPSGHDTDHDRPLAVVAAFTPTGGNPDSPVPLALTLYRPPIVLLHGLWSNNSVWTMPLIGLPYLDIPTPFADYRNTNADHFAVNLLVPETAVQYVLEWDRDQQIAATRADFIAHSMGGILARQWAADAGYYRSSNFMAGDFHKLITLDSPHFGARSDSYVVSIRDEEVVGRVFSTAMYEAGMPLNNGAVDDLEFFSQPIESIGPANVGSHALAGVGGSDFSSFCPGLTGTFIKTVAFFADDTVPELLTRIYGSEPNDVVVGLDSENGPLPSQATSTPIPGPDGVHFCVTASGVYTDAIVGLLNTPVTADAFQFFPQVTPPQGVVASRMGRSRVSSRKEGIPKSSIAIEPLVGGAETEPGATVRVRFTASADVRRVLLITVGDDAVEIGAAPVEADVRIPATASGPVTLIAVGDDGQGFVLSEPMVLTATPSGAIVSLESRPAALTLIAGDPAARLEAYGTFADGIVRRVTGIVGTEIVISDATVATVSASGAVTAVAPGAATLTLRNASASVDVTVKVVGATRQLLSCARCPRIVPAR